MVTVIESGLSSAAVSPCSPSQRGGRFLPHVHASVGEAGWDTSTLPAPGWKTNT